jgi:hypothetical protein
LSEKGEPGVVGTTVEDLELGINEVGDGNVLRGGRKKVKPKPRKTGGDQ